MLMTCDLIETSSAETGSSATISLGLSAKALMIPSRWRWPPENCRGRWPMCRALSPTASSSCAAIERLCFGPLIMPWTTIGSVTIAPAVMRGSSEE
jgi:hypothetical protein